MPINLYKLGSYIEEALNQCKAELPNIIKLELFQKFIIYVEANPDLLTKEKTIFSDFVEKHLTEIQQNLLRLWKAKNTPIAPPTSMGEKVRHAVEYIPGVRSLLPAKDESAEREKKKKIDDEQSNYSQSEKEHIEILELALKEVLNEISKFKDSIAEKAGKESKEGKEARKIQPLLNRLEEMTHELDHLLPTLGGVYGIDGVLSEHLKKLGWPTLDEETLVLLHAYFKQITEGNIAPTIIAPAYAKTPMGHGKVVGWQNVKHSPLVVNLYRYLEYMPYFIRKHHQESLVVKFCATKKEDIFYSEADIYSETLQSKTNTPIINSFMNKDACRTRLQEFSDNLKSISLAFDRWSEKPKDSDSPDNLAAIVEHIFLLIKRGQIIDKGLIDKLLVKVESYPSHFTKEIIEQLKAAQKSAKEQLGGESKMPAELSEKASPVSPDSATSSGVKDSSSQVPTEDDNDPFGDDLDKILGNAPALLTPAFTLQQSLKNITSDPDKSAVRASASAGPT